MEAAGGREWLGFGLYFRGNRIVNNPGRSGELIQRGLNPIGARGSYQDITAMMEEPNIEPGRSWTSQVLAVVPGLFDPKAGTAVKLAIDKAGDFVHNSLLWDRVRDLQFGLADHLSDRLVAKGADRLTADRIATHFSNIIVGSIPKEAMSNAARATANMLLFSRSFTLGNLSTFKQAALGLPKPILAQIERDYFDFKENPETGEFESPQAALGPDAAAAVAQMSKGIARRKAISTIAMSVGLYYVGNALIQHAFNIISRDSSVEEEMNGYARRYASLMSDVSNDPFELRHLLGRLSPTYDNEPSKQDRAFIGYAKDGTAIYARNPTGKFGEELDRLSDTANGDDPPQAQPDGRRHLGHIGERQRLRPQDLRRQRHDGRGRYQNRVRGGEASCNASSAGRPDQRGSRSTARRWRSNVEPVSCLCTAGWVYGERWRTRRYGAW